MPTPEPSHENHELHSLMAQAAERLQRGESIDTVKADLIAQGLSIDFVDRLLTSFAASKWQLGARGWAFRILGVLVILAGVTLWLGNQNGFFVTFPYSGTIVVLVGAALYVLGGGKG